MRKEEPRIDVDLWAECFLANDGKPNVTRMAPFIDALGTYGTARLSVLLDTLILLSWRIVESREP